MVEQGKEHFCVLIFKLAEASAVPQPYIYRSESLEYHRSLVQGEAFDDVQCGSGR